MKKTTKPATGKETKSKAAANVAAKSGQKLKAAGKAKSIKAARTKEALPGAAKAKVGAVIKKTKAAPPKAKPPLKTKMATKPSPVKSPAKRKAAVKTSLKKVSVAVKVKAKTAVKTLKATAPMKVTPKSAVKGPEKKVLSPTPKTVNTRQKKLMPAIKEVRPATTKKKPVIAKEKPDADQLAAKKNVVQAAVPVVKTRKISIKQPAEAIVKAKKVRAEDIKQPLKKKVPAKKALRSIKTEPVVKPLKEEMSALRVTTKPKSGKPEEKPMKKTEKTSAKSLPATVKKTAARKEARPVAAIKGKAAGTVKEPGRKKHVAAPAITAASVKKTRVIMPAVPAVAEEDGEELLSVAEIEAREGYVIKPRLKIFLPKEEAGDEAIEGKEAQPVTGRASLPAEYGESEFFMIVIDPLLIFLDWEIIPGDLPPDGGHLCVRIYDVTGLVFDGTNAHGFIDIDLEGMTGSGYCEIGMQGREILAEIGYINAQGKFIALMRSAAASVPPLLQHDELGIVRKMQEAGLPVGY